MESRSQRDWLQILGQFGVVASLLFVGLQMRQDHEIALSVAYQARTATLVEFLMAPATDDLARSAMSKSISGSTDLTPGETVTLNQLATAGIELMQNSQFQYVNGYLDEEHWQSVRQLIKRQLQIPVWRKLLLGDRVRPSFRRAVEEIDRDHSLVTD